MNVVTSELRKGDLVFEHGMIVLIDGEINISQNHPVRHGVGDGFTRWTLGLVLNRDDERTSVVPRSWTADWDRDRRGDSLPHDGQHRWTIQGNDNARWSIERFEIPAEGYWLCPDCEQPSRKTDLVWIAKHRVLEGQVKG